MAETLFMRVKEVAQELGVSESYAYKLVHELNEELKAMGCITIQGRLDRKYFYEKITILHFGYMRRYWQLVQTKVHTRI